ncbi:DUF559 domain-containing protein [Micromonospora ureilytica]|uniref:DUF559 domain-containing protein n=1 Tax=Micromonospora ureilytica TaxID=709868 RepID=UPI002E1487A5|nr:DUF559 domain-containing protein [Micromonospora ureilytica]
MPPRPHRPDALAWQVFRGSDAVRDGLLTEHQLRNSAWVRLRHDIYADSRLDRDHALACRAALLRLPPGVVVGGPSAAYLHGVQHAASFTDDVHVLVPRSLRIGPQRGLRVHVNAIAPMPDAGRPSSAGRPRDAARPTGAGRPPAGGMSPRPARQLSRPAAVSVGAGGMVAASRGDGWAAASPLKSREPELPIPRSDPGRAAWETAVWLDPVRAVAIVDSLLGQGLTDRDTLAAMAARNADRPGGRRARWVFDLADDRAESPPESQLRVRLVLGGLPRPAVQHPVRLPIGVVLHPDLAWPQYRVAVEYDGKWHSDAEQLHRDRRRLNQLVAAGWLVLHVTSQRLHGEFPAVLREVRDALVSRGWRRGSST